MNRLLNIFFAVAGLCLILSMAAPALAQDEDTPNSPLDIFPELSAARSTADLSQIKEGSKTVRALVTLSKTDFFIYQGQPKGLQAELLHQYEKFLNKGLSRRELKTRITYVPVPFEDLIPALQEGRGDIAAALMTITPEREKEVSFISGHRWKVNEVLVTSRAVNDVNDVYDLAGRSVYVLRGSSYVEHLEKVNEKLASQMMRPVTIVEADRNLLTEDIIELVNAGVVEITVVDDFKAKLWAHVYPDVVVREDIRIAEGGFVGWAIRKDNPELEAHLKSFLPQVRKGSLLGNMLTERYLKDTKWIQNPLDDLERQKLDGFMLFFREYGDEYGFDWLAVVAQAYQESGLDHSVKSSAGAVGIMQLLPSTAEYVGFEDVSEVGANIHAGVKYVAYLRDKYFSDPELTDVDRFAFTWAAYNAGPNKVRKIRSRATKMGLDSNKWFQNTEYAALKIVGQETVTYVANIYKYYIAYALSRDLLDKKAQQLQSIQDAGTE